MLQIVLQTSASLVCAVLLTHAIGWAVGLSLADGVEVLSALWVAGLALGAVRVFWRWSRV